MSLHSVNSATFALLRPRVIALHVTSLPCIFSETFMIFPGPAIKNPPGGADDAAMERFSDSDLQAANGALVDGHAPDAAPRTAHRAAHEAVHNAADTALLGAVPEEFVSKEVFPKEVVPEAVVPVRPNMGDRRDPREDRRDQGDRRGTSLRRGRDRQRNAAANKIAYLGTILCALSVGVATYAFFNAPITFTPSPACADGFGGQKIEHRGLSSLWAVVMVLAAAGLVIPDRKRRPVILMILCGISVGLFAAAYFTVGTKFVGFCID